MHDRTPDGRLRGVRWRTALAVAAVALAAAAAPSPDAERAWSLAYSGYVSRFCPGWEQRLDVLPADFLPLPETWETLWAEGSMRQRAFRAGGKAAEADHARDPGFCAHPTRRHPEHAALLGALLARTSPNARH